MSRPPLTATAYLQIERGVWKGGWSIEARVRRATQKKPDRPDPGCVVVKVQLRIPHEAWDPFQPEAVIDVPADLIQHPIEVEAVDPS